MGSPEVKCEHRSHFKDAGGAREKQEQCSHLLLFCGRLAPWPATSRRRTRARQARPQPSRRRGADPHGGARAPRDPGGGGPQPAGGRERPRHGVVRDLPLRREPGRAAHPPHRRLLPLSGPRGPGGARRRAAPRPDRPVGCGRPRAAHLGARSPSRLHAALRLAGARLRAPAERTGEAGTAVLALLVGLLDDARRAGALADPGHLGLRATTSRRCRPSAGRPDVRRLRRGPDGPSQGLCAWTLLLGAVTSEIFGQLGPLPDAEALFAVFLAAGRSAILDRPSPLTDARPPRVPRPDLLADPHPRGVHIRPQVHPHLCAQRDLLETMRHEHDTSRVVHGLWITMWTSKGSSPQNILNPRRHGSTHPTVVHTGLWTTVDEGPNLRTTPPLPV